jgi:hemoglobin-like flavoprotein
LNPTEKQLVQASFEQVKGMSDVFASLFYSCLFDLDPGLEPLLIPDAQRQGRRLMHMIGLAVKRLDTLDQLIPRLQALGSRYAAYDLDEHDYMSIRRAWLWTLERLLGAFTPEVKQAWTNVCELLTNTIKSEVSSVVIFPFSPSETHYLNA